MATGLRGEEGFTGPNQAHGPASCGAAAADITEGQDRPCAGHAVSQLQAAHGVTWSSALGCLSPLGFTHPLSIKHVSPSPHPFLCVFVC